MKAASKFIAVVATSLALGMPASAQDDLSAQGILAIGKMTGACGIMDSMIQFQKTTRMEGGGGICASLLGGRGCKTRNVCPATLGTVQQVGIRIRHALEHS